MKNLLFTIFIIFIIFQLPAQNTPDDANSIRKKMAIIRQSTNWSDPAAAKKANEEIQKLAKQLSGSNSQLFQNSGQQTSPNDSAKSVDFEVKTAATKENILVIADRFFERSYKRLNGISKIQFDQDYAKAEKDSFSFEAVRKLCNTGGVLISFGNDHNIACVYLASAVKVMPVDTLSVNNFGGYLRIIDSVKVSVPVLLYANKLFSESPVILTQLGNSYFELHDYKNAELFYKDALKHNPDFGQAHTSLCELYLQQGRLHDAIMELFAGVKGMSCSYANASGKFQNIQNQYSKAAGGKDDFKSKEKFWDETKKQVTPSDAAGTPDSQASRVKMPVFPDCQKVEDWLEGGGYSSAVMALQGFQNYLMSFSRKFLQVQKQLPELPPDATLRDYPNERFSLDCITEMFREYSNQELMKYQESIVEISQRANDAKELYLKHFEAYAKECASCSGSCRGDEKCLKECHRKYCLKECPSARMFNELLTQVYNDYRISFSDQTSKQIKLLDDLYAFTGPWLAKINSPYWSRIYAFEVKGVALGIVGNCYASYPQAFQLPAHNDCGTDCSAFAVPFTE